jgi:uncharacterized RDD family membrane protein YckC
MTDYPGSGAPGAERPDDRPQPGYPQQAPPGYPQPGQPLPSAPPVPTGYGYGQMPEQAVPAGLYYDQQSGLLLPNGTELASVGRRIGAYFLAIPLVIVTLGIGYIIWGLMLWPDGRTPAASVLGMQVWRPDDQRKASFGWMALREIVGRIADGILSLITELTSFILMCTGRERKALHDYVAGTVVLYDPNKVLREPKQN